MTNKPIIQTTSEDDQLPILQRRRIEANIIAPIYEQMVAQLGKEKAQEIIKAAITKDARAAGARFAAGEPSGANLTTFIDIQELWRQGDALITDTVTQTEDKFEFNVTSCAYAEMYREMGLAELGPLLSCVRDYEFIAGYDPRIAYSRSQTLMEGASHCDFHYEVRK